MNDVIIIGGGLAGLINAILLASGGWKVMLLEKYDYPFHRVCGEYISNEVVPFLKSLDAYPIELKPASISQFELTAINGKKIAAPLLLGGFGISRYAFDNFLAEKARQAGAEIKTSSTVSELKFKDEYFEVSLTSGHTFSAKMVLGCFGKRSSIDKALSRPFIKKKSPYLAVKYHIRTDHPDHLVALHNFDGGYCGINKVEKDVSNLCYLVSRSKLKESGSIKDLEVEVLSKNPVLRQILNSSEFLFEKPLVINEVTFDAKEPIFNHVLMSGDSAGMIAPLCGNGMAMAIHSAKISSEKVNDFLKGNTTRKQMELLYHQEWRKLFSRRLWLGRNIQKMFGAKWSSGIVVSLLNSSKSLTSQVIRQTHGSVF